MGRKMVSSLLPQEEYAYYKNHYIPTSNEVLLQREYLKGGRKKNYHISYPGSKTGMFIAKNYNVASAEFAYFLMKTKLALLGEILSKMLSGT